MSEDGTQVTAPMTARQRNKIILAGLPNVGLVCGGMMPFESEEGVATNKRQSCGGTLKLMSPADVCVIDLEGDLYEVAAACPECGGRQRVYFNIAGEHRLHEEAMVVVLKKMGAKPGQAAPEQPLEKKKGGTSLDI